MNKGPENKLKSHSSRYSGVMVFLAVFGVQFLTAACNGTPEDIAKITGVEEASQTLSSPFKFDPDSYDFGNQTAYTSTTDKTITMTNSSAKSVFIDSMNGTNSNFSLTSDTCPRSPNSLAPNQTCSATLRFAPIGTGVLSVSLTIKYGQSSGSKDQSQALELTGTGVQDKDSNSGALSFSPSPYGFGSLVAGLGSVDKVIVITNTLSRDVYISSISGNKAPFSIGSSTCPAPTVALQSAKSCTVTVTFAPSAEGDFSMTLRVDFGLVAKGSELSASSGITGTGSSPSAVGNAAITFSPSTNDFGAVRAGSGTSTKVIEVTNGAAIPIYIAAITKTNLNYSITTDTCPRSPTALASAAKCTVTVRFAPLTGGDSSSNVKATYGLSAGENNFSATVSLVGTGVGSLDFAGLETANPITTTTATLNWTHVTGALNYFIFRLAGDGSSTLVTTVTPPTATYAATGLTPATSYTYFVKAIDQLGTQDSNSNLVTFTTKSLGTFASISDLSVAEAATGQTAALSCSDAYGSTPSYSITSQSDSDSTCTLTAAPIKISCTPYKTGHSSWTSALSVQCSLNGSTFTKSFTVTATDTNRSPSVDSIANQSVTAGSAISAINAADGGDDFDVDLDALSYSCTFSGGGFAGGTNCTSLPGTRSFSASAGTLSWTPSYAAAVADVSTDYSIVIVASDQQSSALTHSRTFTVTVTPKPIFAAISTLTVAENATGQTAALSCADELASSPSYTLVSQSDAAGNCSISSGTVSCSPSYKTGHSTWTSTLSVKCTINGADYTRAMTLSVTDTNRAPVLTTIADQTLVAGTAISSVNASDSTASTDFDIDLDALAYTCTFSGGGNSAGTNCTSLPGTPAMNASTGVLTWTTSYGAAVSASNTTYTITITGSDQQGSPLTNAKSFAVTVTPATPSLTANSDQVFPSNYLNQGSTLSLDWNNIREGSPGSDTGVTYACVYDQVIDGTVSSGTNCSSLGGTVSFSTSAATFSWTPNATVWGAYEIKITGTNAAGSGDDVVIVDVRPAYVTTNLRGNWDAQFGELTKPGSGSLTSWSDLTSNVFDGTNNNSTNAAWAGTGVYSSPYRLTYDGSGRTDFGSSVMSGQTKMMFSSWVAPTTATSLDKVIIGNSSNGTGNGFTVRQAKKDASKIEFVIGKTYRDVVLADSPVGYWRLGETSGSTATDISGNNNGTYTGGYTLSSTGAVSADSDLATTFNGSSSYVDCTNSSTFNVTTRVSLEAWVYPSSNNQNGGVIGKWTSDAQRAYSLYLGQDAGTNKFGFIMMQSNGVVKSVFPTNTFAANLWYHVVAVADGSNLRIYINGSDTGQTTAYDGSINVGTNKFLIGKLRPEDNVYSYSGRVDEAAVYNYALTAAQVLAHYNAGLGTYGGICYSTSTFSNGAWNFLSGLFDGSTAKLFVNGRQECSVTAPATLTSPVTNLVAASSSASSQANAWSGSIADLKIYGSSDGSSVGSSSDIVTNFNAAADRFRANPVSSSGIVTNGLVFNLDAVNGDGLRYPGSGCSFTKWLDLSASGLTGTLTSFSSCGATSGWNGDGTSTVSGTAGPYRLTLDGTDDYLVLGNASTIQIANGSIAAWVKTSSPGSGIRSVLTKASAFSLFLLDGKLAVYDWSSGVTRDSGVNVADGAWHYLVVTFQSGVTNGTKLYEDGSLKMTTTMTITSQGSNLQLGSNGGSQYLNGEIAAASLYTSILSASEISQNCNALKARFSGATCN